MLAQSGTIKWNDTGEEVERLFGIVPEGGRDNDDNDDHIFYWLEESERVVGFNNGEFTILSLDAAEEI